MIVAPKGHVGMGQNLVPLVNIKIAGKWMFIPLKMVSIGIDPYPCVICHSEIVSRLSFFQPEKIWDLKAVPEGG